MKRLLPILFATLMVLGPGMTSPALAADRALCLVCKVKGGESAEEEVKAWRTHQGVRYGFCSESCANEFDSDPAAYVPPQFPRPAPPLSLTALDGSAVNWDSLAGKVVLVDFWATWCVPCRKSMPRLQALHQRYSGRGFSVLGISIDAGKDAAKVKKFASSKRIAYPIAIDSDESSAWQRFGVKAVPAAFLVDSKGQIVAQWTGAAPDDHELEQRLAAMLERQP